MAPHTRVKVVEIPKGSGRWYVRANYLKHRKTKYYGSKERAEAVAEKLSTALRLFGLEAFKMLSEVEAKATPTLRAFAERWLSEIDKGDLKLSTRKMYRSNLDYHILPALGGLLVSDIDYAVIKGFLLSKRDSTYSTGRFRNLGKKRKYAVKAEDRSYSRDTVRIMAMTLRALLGEAVREKVLHENPVKNLAFFYRKRKKDRVVTRSQVYMLEELYAIEDQLKNRALYGDDYEMSLAQSRTGMRIGEVRGLQWDDFDWKEKQIHVSRNIPSGTNVEEDTTKTEAGERVIEMSDELCLVLGALQARHRAEGMKTGKRGNGVVFSSRYEDFVRDWRRAQAQAGIRYRSPHSLRHTYASQMLEAGANPAWLAKQMGHSSPKVTWEIYSHFIPNKKPQAVNVMDREKANANEMQNGKKK